MRVVLLIGFCLLAACKPSPQVPPTPAAAPIETASPTPAPSPATMANGEPLDPFLVMVGAERWGVIIDKAHEGAIEAPEDVALSEDQVLRADMAVKDGAAALLELRNRICGKGLMKGDACIIKDWPAWASEPPTSATPLAEIERRSDWLSLAMSPFTDLGCAEGRKASKDEMFCSVE